MDINPYLFIYINHKFSEFGIFCIHDSLFKIISQNLLIGRREEREETNIRSNIFTIGERVKRDLSKLELIIAHGSICSNIVPHDEHLSYRQKCETTDV